MVFNERRAVRTDKLAILYTYCSLNKSFSADGIFISVENNRGNQLCSKVMGSDQDKNINLLYEAVRHRIFVTCCYIEAENENSVKE